MVMMGMVVSMVGWGWLVSVEVMLVATEAVEVAVIMVVTGSGGGCSGRRGESGGGAVVESYFRLGSW